MLLIKEYKKIRVELINVSRYDKQKFDEILNRIHEDVEVSPETTVLKVNKQIHWAETTTIDKHGYTKKSCTLEWKVKHGNYTK